jgi:prepilin-type N-terminal cleavage/methylation domain-containing protein
MKGFTIIESLIAVAITLILAGLILPNYRYSSQALAFEQSAVTLEQALRRAQQMAMSAKEFNGIIPRGGYGVYVSSSNAASYILFADCNNPPNYRYDASGNNCNGSPEKVEEISLGSGITFSSLSPSSPLHVVFTPPFPLVTISGAGTEASFGLTLSGTSKTKTVRVNKAGLIEAQ